MYIILALDEEDSSTFIGANQSLLGVSDRVQAHLKKPGVLTDERVLGKDFDLAYFPLKEIPEFISELDFGPVQVLKIMLLVPGDSAYVFDTGYFAVKVV